MYAKPYESPSECDAAKELGDLWNLIVGKDDGSDSYELEKCMWDKYDSSESII